jgi:hypothetical protein
MMATKQRASIDPQGLVAPEGPGSEVSVVVGRVTREAPGPSARVLGRVTREAAGPSARVLGRVVRTTPEPGARALGCVVREGAALAA